MELEGVLSDTHGHQKTVCVICEKVITQCRCYSENKVINRTVCESCRKKMEEVDDVR